MKKVLKMTYLDVENRKSEDAEDIKYK